MDSRPLQAAVDLRVPLPGGFGLGGYVVITTARESLSTQIRFRLDEHAASLNLVVDRSLELLGRRVEDFASDGFIRLQLQQLSGVPRPGDEAEIEAVRDRLVRHLRANKLPLVEEFVDAYLLDADGQRVLAAHASGEFRPRSFDRDGFWVGPLESGGREFQFPTFVLSTPVSSLEGGQRLGYLQVVVRADVWARSFEGTLEFPGATGFTAQLSSPDGHTLSLLRVSRRRSRPAGRPTRFDSRARFPVPGGNWTWRWTGES